MDYKVLPSDFLKCRDSLEFLIGCIEEVKEKNLYTDTGILFNHDLGLAIKFRVTFL